MANRTFLMDAVRRGYKKQPPKQWPIYNSTEDLDRSTVLTASEATACLRRLWYEKNLPLEVGEDLGLGAQWRGMAERGHTAEAWVVEQLKLANVSIICTGSDQVSFVWEKLSGTPDGILISDTAEYLEVIDIKSFDPRTNKKNLPKPSHVAQVTANCYLVSQNMDLPVGRGRILYVNANDYNDMYEHSFQYVDGMADEIVRRSELVTSAGNAEDLQPEGMFSGDCRFCAYGTQCSAAVEYNKEQQKADKARTAISGQMFK